VSEILFKKVDYTVSKLIQDIEFGDIGLPDIQRPFVWTATRVRDLFDSMYKGFPVGYLLFWANDHFNGTKQIGTGEKQRRVPRLLIIDGQQRLTSLYAVLRGKSIFNSNYKEECIQIAFRPRDGKFEVTDAAIKRDPEFIPNISAVWNSGGHFLFINEFLEKLQKTRELDITIRNEIANAIDCLFDLQNYPFTALEISSNVNEEQVADIFVRINSEGVKLNQADFLLTLMSVFWDEGRAELERFSRLSRIVPTDSQPSPFNHFIKPDPDQLLRVEVALGFKRARLMHVYSILRGKDMETGQFSDKERVHQFSVLEKVQDKTLNLTSWHEFLKCLIKAGYRSEAMISSQIALLYAYAFYLIGKEDFNVESFKLRNLTARWFFMTSITGRYSASPESTMESDLTRLRGLSHADEFIGTLEHIIDSVLTNDFWEITLANDLETSSPRNPALLAYYATLNNLGAPVLFSKTKISDLLDPMLKTPRSSIERHHLFPRGYLESIGINDLKIINQVANYSYIDWADHVEISDKPPFEYFPFMIKKLNLHPKEFKEMCYFHALPEGWQKMNYNEFLGIRRSLMAEIIRKGFKALS